MDKKEAVFRQKTFGIEEIAEIMLSNPDLYVNRRPHGWNKLDLAPVVRTVEATCRFIEESLMAGQAVHIRGFATFAFRKDVEDDERMDTITRADFRARQGCCGGGGVAPRGATPHVHETSFLPLFRLDRAMATRTGLCEKKNLDMVPKYMGSIWSSRAKPVPPNPYTISRAAGVEKAFAIDVLLDFFLAVVDTMVAGRRVVLPLGFGTMTFEGAAAQGVPSRAGIDPARLVAFKWRPELVRWVKGCEERARESNRHAVGHRRFFESSETVSDAWKRRPSDMHPTQEMLGVGRKRGNYHRPYSASTMASQTSQAMKQQQRNGHQSSQRGQREQQWGTASHGSQMRKTGQGMNSTRPQSAFVTSGSRRGSRVKEAWGEQGYAEQGRSGQQHQQYYEEEEYNGQRRGHRGGGGSIAGSSSSGMLF